MPNPALYRLLQFIPSKEAVLVPGPSQSGYGIQDASFPLPEGAKDLGEFKTYGEALGELAKRRPAAKLGT